MNKHQNIVQALVAASASLQGVAKDGKAGKMYEFVSHEAMVAVARGPLLENGLALTCADICDVESFFDKGQHYYQGNFKWKLMHCDSEQVEIQWAPGMGQDKGDKAAAKAMTYSHKQALRFLLNIPIKDKGFEADLDFQPKPPPPTTKLEDRRASTKTRTRSFQEFKANPAGVTKVSQSAKSVGRERYGVWRKKAEQWGFSEDDRRLFVTEFFSSKDGTKKFGWENIEDQYWQDFLELDEVNAETALKHMKTKWKEKQSTIQGVGGA